MAVRILHAHSGLIEPMRVRLMNAFGDRAEHVVFSADPAFAEVRPHLDPRVRVKYPTDAPPLSGRPGLTRLYRLSRFMRAFDLVLSYNWGVIDLVMARHLFGGPPLIHHVDGEEQDEADRGKRSRAVYRRLGLSSVHKLVVPSRHLAAIARTEWRQPVERIEQIAPAIRTAAFGVAPVADAIPGFARRAGECVIGTIAGLDPTRNLPRLVRAVAAMQCRNVRLIIIGEGPESEHIAAEARRCGIADRLLMPGSLPDPAAVLGHFDIFALSSDNEECPVPLIEAMAAGLPVAATEVGDVPFMVSPDNRPLIVSSADEAALAASLDTLVDRPDLRHGIGRANRDRAQAEFDERAMIARYARLYGEAIGEPRAFIS